MTMTPFECAQMWRGYKKHNAAMLRTLAELNATTPENMRMTLLEAGVRPLELPRAERKKTDPVRLTTEESEARLLPGEEKLAAAIENMKEEKTVNEEMKNEVTEEAEPEYNLPPAPKYAEDTPKYWSAEEVRELLARAFADFVGGSCDAVRLSHSDAGAEMMNILAAQDYRMTVEDMLDER